jgi:uncharacterized protein (TIGR02453 family)
MNTPALLQFLSELSKNNNREWFSLNKSRYDKLQQEFVAFLDELIPMIAKFDSSVAAMKGKECMFRIYRDVRFSHDKSPYKTHFGAMIMAGKKKSEIHNKAGYYIHIEPDASMLAGGAYLPPSGWLRSIRNAIYFQPNDFKKIIEDKTFVKTFGEISGEKLSRPPQGFDASYPEVELLKYKSYTAIHSMSNQDLGKKNLIEYTATIFRTMYPLNSFLNEAGEVSS